jgi:hypothetical protein
MYPVRMASMCNDTNSAHIATQHQHARGEPVSKLRVAHLHIVPHAHSASHLSFVVEEAAASHADLDRQQQPTAVHAWALARRLLAWGYLTKADTHVLLLLHMCTSSCTLQLLPSNGTLLLLLLLPLHMCTS